MITYRYVLTAHKPGQYALKPFKIKYWGKNTEQENHVLTDTIAFKVVRFTWWGPALAWTIIIFAVILFAILVCIAFITNKRISRKKLATRGKQVADREYLIAKLNQCRQSKLEGNYVAFYQAALDISRIYSHEETTLLDKVSSMLEKVRFGGYKPASDEIEQTLRRLEKKVGGILSDKKDKELEYLKYCE